jgi:hypothetical protein
MPSLVSLVVDLLHSERTWGLALAGAATVMVLSDRTSHFEYEHEKHSPAQSKSQVESSFRTETPEERDRIERVLSTFDTAAIFERSVSKTVVSSFLKILARFHDSMKAVMLLARPCRPTQQSPARRQRRRSISCPVRPLRNILRRLWKDLHQRLSEQKWIQGGFGFLLQLARAP